MFSTGQQIGPYSLLRLLGTGGFGEVWLAERRSQFLTKKVAVKLPHNEQIDFETIRREAELWEMASGHPNVLPIIDADVYDGQVVIVSEYADGGSLAERLKSLGTPTVNETIELMIGILNGLEFLHERQIIHRDIKPQNILLQSGKPRLADFGISRAMQTTAASSTVIGTDAYMSPEAFDGKRTVQTDIWSTGVVLYQLLNSALPFPQQHPSERMFAVLTKDFEPLADSVPPIMRQIVETALAKMPEYRYETAAAMRESLVQAKRRIETPEPRITQSIAPPSISLFADAPPVSDPDATVIRVQIPVAVEQETFVRQAYPAPPPPNFARPDPFQPAVTPDTPPTGSQPDRVHEGPVDWFSEYGLQGIVGVGTLILLGFIGLMFVFSLSKPASPALNRPVVFSTPANSVKTPANKRAANANSSASNSKAATTANKSPYCNGYLDGWNAGYDSIKGNELPVSDIPCPDERNYRDKSYEDGKTAGYSQGMTAAKKSN